MRNFLPLYCFILTLSLLPSCRKDDMNSLCGDIQHIGKSYTSLTFGNDSSVVIYNAESITTQTKVKEGITYVTQHVDLFNNCSSDIQLQKSFVEGDSLLTIKLFALYTDISVAAQAYHYTDYRYFQDSYYDFNGGVEHYLTTYSSNVPLSIPADEIGSSSIQAPVYNKYGETFLAASTHSGSVYFRNKSISDTHFSQTGYANDTIHFERLIMYEDFIFPPLGEYVYVGFRYDSPLGIKLGWIKLSALSASNIEIIEVALQR